MQYIVKTLAGTAKITAASPAKAAKIVAGGSVIRCKHRDSSITVRKGKYSAYYRTSMVALEGI